MNLMHLEAQPYLGSHPQPLDHKHFLAGFSTLYHLKTSTHACIWLITSDWLLYLDDLLYLQPLTSNIMHLFCSIFSLHRHRCCRTLWLSWLFKQEAEAVQTWRQRSTLRDTTLRQSACLTCHRSNQWNGCLSVCVHPAEDVIIDGLFDREKEKYEVNMNMSEIWRFTIFFYYWCC